MLQSLYLKNIAIFDEVSVPFEAGYHALTGETGAGKSILIDAVNLILGGKASRDIIRSGAQSALVSAVFSISGKLAAELSNEYPEAENGELSITREITKEGRGSCKIGARPVTVSVLKEVGLRLVNIHGQSDNQSLYKKEVHIDYLDRFCNFGPAMEQYQAEYRQYRELSRKIERLETETSMQESRAEELAFLSEELAAAKLVEGEGEKLREKKRLFLSREKLLKAVYAVYGLLYEMPEGGSVYDLLKSAQRELSPITQDSQDVQAAYDRLEELSVLARDVAQDVQALSEGSDFSPEELEELELRLDLITRLERKYGRDEAGLLAYQKEVDDELFELTHRGQALKAARREWEESRARLLNLAQQLSQMRQKTGLELEKRIAQELKDLDMPGVQFQIRIRCQENEDGPHFCETGFDSVEFLIAPNAGEGLLPISKIASGGEMARIMLAIKSVMASVETVDTLIFDEIDTGVSGRAAQKIAQKMYALSRKKQVMAVTHLPQLASMADVHYRISKRTDNGRTSAQILPLDLSGRIQEIARMTGGVEITQKTLANAQEILDLAEEYRRSFSGRRRL